MNNVLGITTTVMGDEKVWDYFELHENSVIPGKGVRRYRIMQVVRDGKLAEYREDMGSAKKFKGVNQIHIPALFEHTVDELRDLADGLRGGHTDLQELLQLDNFKVG